MSRGAAAAGLLRRGRRGVPLHAGGETPACRPVRVVGVGSVTREGAGADLFVRNTRQVRLTPAGAALLVEARRTLAASTACADAVASVQGLLRGNLSIGTLQCLHVVHLPTVLSRFVTTYPKLDIEFRTGGSGELTGLVGLGRMDV